MTSHSLRSMMRRIQLIVALVFTVVAVLGSLTIPTPASASVTMGSIDPSAVGILTIHRTAGSEDALTRQPTFGTSGSALDQSNGGGTPVPGSTFTLSRIDGVDLTTPEGQQLASELMADVARASAMASQPITSQPTDSSGITQFSDLPVGLYLLREVTTPEGVGPVRDLVIPLPVPDPMSPDRWIYTIDVYPKPFSVPIVPITKSVEDGNAGVAGEDAPVAGTVMTFSFASGIGTGGLSTFGGSCVVDGATDTQPGVDIYGFASDGWCADGATWTGTDGGAAYRIVDDLTESTELSTGRPTSDFLEFADSDWRGSVTVALSDGTVLTECGAESRSCDYTLTQMLEHIEINLTTQGMELLASAKARDLNATLIVTAQARVTSNVTDATTLEPQELAAAGLAPTLQLTNQVMLFPNGASVADGRPVPSDITRSIYSTLRLHKTDGEGTNLSGAVFTLYRTLADARSNSNPIAVSAPTDVNGMTQFPGLHVTDFQNNGPDTDSYWAVETTVPQGYTGLTSRFEVQLSQDGTTVQADGTGGMAVLNTPSEVPVLPETDSPTGLFGFLPVTGVGGAIQLGLLAAVLLGSGWMILAALRRSRRSEDNA